ncbi:MAG TPA: hypothetical protein VNV37_02135 [Solirubrobacteraceae bacterium]|jgi:hypothetical protein|nr:hypothetical protein [Solirubrobacteraceae bacterium]
MSGHSTRTLAFLICALLASVAPAALATATGTPKPPPKPKPPHASTGAAPQPNQTTVALYGTVNPHGVETTCYFQYGTSTAYGSQTPPIAAGSGTANVKVSQPLTGLTQGTTYHYRLLATNANGTSEGADHTFTTKQTPLRFVLTRTSTVQAFGGRLTLTGTLAGGGGAGQQVLAQTSSFPYFGGFADVGAAVATNPEGGFSYELPSFTQTTQVRVRTLSPLPVYSSVLTVRVAASVTLRARATSTPGTVRLSGSVAPAENGATVLFQRVRRGYPPLTVASTTARAAGRHGSRFTATVNIRRSGAYRALVKVTNGRQVSGASRTLQLRGAPPQRLRKGRR